MDNNVQTTIPNMQEFIASREKDKIDQIFDSMKIIESEKSRLPEHIFVSYFLPFFIGQRQVDEKNNYPAQWISIAGSPTSEVDVIDSSGTVLYTVPAFFNTKKNNPVGERGNLNFNALISAAELLKSRSPIESNNTVNQLYQAKMSKYINTNIDSEDAKKWKFIFDKYKITSNIQEDKEEDKEEVSKGDEYYFD